MSRMDIGCLLTYSALLLQWCTQDFLKREWGSRNMHTYVVVMGAKYQPEVSPLTCRIAAGFVVPPT